MAKSLFYLLVCAAGLAGHSYGAVDPKPTVLFVGMGGYHSCQNSTLRGSRAPHGIKLYPAFERLVKHVSPRARGSRILTLVSCLHNSAPPRGEAEYILSDSPSKVRHGDTVRILDTIEQIALQSSSLDVFIVGHSYGGWMSMYLTEHLSNRANVRALFTLDPIGPACGTMGVVFGDSNCHRAPRDRNNKAIANRVEAWVNFYQKDDTWLTSSSIPEAENHHIEFPWGPHSDINREPIVWETITEVVNALWAS